LSNDSLFIDQHNAVGFVDVVSIILKAVLSLLPFCTLEQNFVFCSLYGYRGVLSPLSQNQETCCERILESRMSRKLRRTPF